jgi:hypothetical protein
MRAKTPNCAPDVLALDAFTGSSGTGVTMIAAAVGRGAVVKVAVAVGGRAVGVSVGDEVGLRLAADSGAGVGVAVGGGVAVGVTLSVGVAVALGVDVATAWGVGEAVGADGVTTGAPVFPPLQIASKVSG